MDIEISVIIPTFNRKHVVSNSIDSVLSQNEEGVEIVVVDDVSTDGTTEFIKKEYKNIILVELEKNSGQNVARNRGASLASGEWLLFLDSDDTLTNGSLRHLKDLLKKVTSDIIFSACIDSDGKITSNKPNWN